MLSSEGLSQLKKAAKDSLKRKLIARDETLVGGLVLCLSNNDKKIVIDSLDILLLLSAPVENREFIFQFIGMQAQLSSLANEYYPLDHIRKLSRQLIERLQSDQPAVHQSGLREHNSNQNNLPSHNPSSRRLHKPAHFITASKFKTITLQVQGLDDKSDMEMCKECLLTVKGLVSITFDLPKHRTIVRVKPEITAYVLADAISSCNLMMAEQVVRKDTGEEQFIPLIDCQEKKENLSLPAYLPDVESPIKVDDKAMRRFKAEEDEENGSWLGAAKSFLARSFYW